MKNTGTWIEFAIELHNIAGFEWKDCIDMIPARETEAIEIVKAFAAGLFTDHEIDTFFESEFLLRMNKIRIERAVFGKFA